MKTAAKDFKMTELGPIPKDWEVKRLGEMADIQLGKMIDEEKNVGEEKLYLSNRDIHWGWINVSDLHKVRMTKDDLCKYDLRKGDLLVCEGGEVGRAAVWDAPISDCYFQKTLHRIRLKDGSQLDLLYLLALLYRYANIGFYDAYVTKTSIAHLPKDKMEILPLILPPLPEQRKIAAALSDVDEMIAALKKLIEKNRKIKTGAMQRLLTGKTRLPGFKGAWVEKRLGELGDVVTGSTPPRGVSECWGGDYNWISAKDFKNKYIVDAAEKITAKGKAFCRLLPAESVLVTCIASIGLNAIAQKPCATNQQINAIICKACDHEFLYYQIDAAKDRMRELAGQTAVPIINKGDFEGLLISLPPTLAEQKAITKVLGDMDEEIVALEAELAKTRQLKQGMMQELLTGKVRLSRAVTPVVE